MADRPATSTHMSADAFLEWDTGDEMIWELIDGVPRHKFPPNPDLFGQAAPNDQHNIVVQNLGFAIDAALRHQGRPCLVMVGSAQRTPRRRDRIRIPDLMVKCGPTVHLPNVPILVAEVVSPSNSHAELSERVADFKAVDTVQEILVIQQQAPILELHRRMGDLWPIWRLEGPAATVTLDSVDVTVTLRDLYRGVLRPDDVTDDAAG